MNTPTPHISTLSLHDALPILHGNGYAFPSGDQVKLVLLGRDAPYLRGSNDTAFAVTVSRLTVTLETVTADRKSTRLNSSHVEISYAVFCLKKKIAIYPVSTSK